MLSAALPKQIGALVDSLRKRDEEPISLTEVAAVTEVLIKTMQLYFRSVDLRIYQECQSLSEYISNARREIASLQPEDAAGANIPRAGKELEAIVAHTEEATNTIMGAAEDIMSADASDVEAYKATVQDAVMRIFEACSFQDITGQRISKVVETISYVERRANELKSLLDVETATPGGAPAMERDDGRHLLGGPALKGEGIDQSAVDALMDFDPVDDDAVTMSEVPDDDPEVPAAQQPAAASVAPPLPSATPKADDSRTTQADIDALFG